MAQRPYWYPYTGDGYGERGEDALPYLQTMTEMVAGAGTLPEQAWDGDDVPAHRRHRRGLKVPPHSLRGLTRNTSNSLAQARLHLAGAIIPDAGAIFRLAICPPAPAPAHISWELNQGESGETVTNDADLVVQIARLPPFTANSRLLKFRISTDIPARGYPIDILPETIEKE